MAKRALGPSTTWWLEISALYILAMPGAVSAHHSIAAFYDRSATSEVEGVVTSMFWRNPHVGITLLVENEQGEQEEWKLEGGTLNDLRRTGFETESLNVGDRVRAVGGPSRRGENALSLSILYLPDGQEVSFFGYGTATSTVAAAASNTLSATGIFRVWSNAGSLYQLRAPLSLTPRPRKLR